MPLPGDWHWTLSLWHAFTVEQQQSAQSLQQRGQSLLPLGYSASDGCRCHLDRLWQELPTKRPQKVGLDTISIMPSRGQEYPPYFSLNTCTTVMCQQEHRTSISQKIRNAASLQLRCISQLTLTIKRNVNLSFLCLTSKLGKQSRKLIKNNEKKSKRWLYGHRWPLTVALSLLLVTFRPYD